LKQEQSACLIGISEKLNKEFFSDDYSFGNVELHRMQGNP
jgi:hypothetical protein